jgi:phage baseplate assembly protein W
MTNGVVPVPPSNLAKPFTVGAVRPGLPRTALPPQLFYFNDLNRRFQQTSNQLVITSVDALNMDIDNILECPKKSFMFNRGFGSQIKSILFEPMNDLTANKLKILFIEAIQAWEPRVRLDFQNSVVVPYPDIHQYVAYLIYTILSNNQIALYVRALPTQIGQ